MKNIFAAILVAFVGFQGFAQTETSGRQGIYRTTHTKTTELHHTKLKVNFDFAKEQLNGEEWLTASPYFYPSDSLVLNAKGMLIHEVAIDNNGSRRPLTYKYLNDILNINLDKTYARNQKYTVYIKYTARPNEVKQSGSAAINDAKGLYFINAQGKDPNKPTQVWTQGETESSSAWFPTIDKPNQKTTQEIYMTVPDKYVTLSNGLLKSSVKEAGNLRTDYWVMDKKHSPYLFFMGVGDFAVVKDKWRAISVDYYVEKEYEPYAKQIFGLTPEMIEFYSKKLNYDFPWSKYSQIVIRDFVSGAMENTTATSHEESAQQKPGDLIDENKWEATIAHELFHHWFGDLVTAESWSNLTVNESFANYSEYLWFEHKYGKDFADFHMMMDINRYKNNPADVAKDLVRHDFASREDMFDLVSYNKGGSILHMLRNYLGDDAFFAGLTDYLKTNEYGNAEAHQLRLSLEKVSGKDLNWFFNQWYFGNAHPKINARYNYEPVKKQVTVTLTQNQQGNYFEFPLAIDIYEGGKPKRHNVWATAKTRNEFVFNTVMKPDFVNVNADGVLLAEIEEVKSPENYFMQYSQSKELKNRFLAVENAGKNATNSASVKTLAAALKDPFFRIRMEALKGIDLSKTEHRSLAAEVERLANSDPKTLVQGVAISTLAKSRDRKYLPLYEKAMSSVSNAVKGNALAAIAALAPEKLSALAPQLDLSNASEDLINALLPTIVHQKIEAQRSAIAPTVVFYPFIKFENAQLGAAAEEGFNWIMQSDDLPAIEKMVKVLNAAKSQVSQNPQAMMAIASILKEGLAKKVSVLRANPKSESLQQQAKLLSQAIEAYN